MPAHHGNYKQLRKFCLDGGADLFGVADISKERENFDLSAELLKDLDKAVSLGVRISQTILADIKDTPTKLYFHHYRTANIFLDQLAFRVGNWLQNQGFKALAIPASQILDWQKQTAHLSHKKIGNLAGLGWLGRNNLLINDKLGASFRLVTILTDMDLSVGKPKKFDCGKCKSCIDVCPVGAIKENPEDFDHIVCFEKLKEFQTNRVVDQFICGICIKACPLHLGN